MVSPTSPPDVPGLPNQAFAYVDFETFDTVDGYIKTHLRIEEAPARGGRVEATTDVARESFMVPGAEEAKRLEVRGTIEDGTIEIVTHYLVVLDDDGAVLELSCYGVEDVFQPAACEDLFDSVRAG